MSRDRHHPIPVAVLARAQTARSGLASSTGLGVAPSADYSFNKQPLGVVSLFCSGASLPPDTDVPGGLGAYDDAHPALSKRALIQHRPPPQFHRQNRSALTLPSHQRRRSNSVTGSPKSVSEATSQNGKKERGFPAHLAARRSKGFSREVLMQKTSLGS